MKKLVSILFLLFIPLLIFSQDPGRFKDEISKFFDSTETYDVVFTGSSSIRKWKSLSKDFPGTSLINTGFGGSQMHDLAYYVDELIISYRPKKIFIYEGDNDLVEKKSTEQILGSANRILDAIFDELENAEVYLISAKPSPSRFHLKANYEALNKELEALSKLRDHVEYIDVWTPMLNKDGQPLPGIFVSDKLHMNAKGYAIWTRVIGPYLN